MVGLLFRFVLDPNIGAVNYYLGHAIPWTTEVPWAWVSLVGMTVWWTLGFNFVLYPAGLQEIPRELYEAASVDGAGPWTQMWRITVPMLRRTTLLVTALQVLASLKVFDQIYLMTSGGPDGATRPILEYVYDNAFTGYRLGYAAAASVIFFGLIIAVSLVRLLRRSSSAAMEA